MSLSPLAIYVLKRKRARRLSLDFVVDAPKERPATFSRVPVEVLHRILAAWKEDCIAGVTDDYYPYYYELIALQSVGRIWKDVIDKAPSLWNWINQDAFNPRLRRKILANSRTALLDVTAELDFDFDKTTKRMFVQDVCGVSHRWKTLELFTSTLDCPLVHQIMSSCASNLISFHVYRNQAVSQERIPFELFQGSATRLRSLRLPCRSSGSSLASFPELTELDYLSLPSSFAPETVDAFVEQLPGRVSNLELITLPPISRLAASSSTATTRVLLPNVQQLTAPAMGSSDLDFLLKCIDIPQANLFLHFTPDDLATTLRLAERFGSQAKPTEVIKIDDSPQCRMVGSNRDGKLWVQGLRVLLGGEGHPAGVFHIYRPFHPEVWRLIFEAIFEGMSEASRAAVRSIIVEQSFLTSREMCEPLADLACDFLPNIEQLAGVYASGLVEDGYSAGFVE